MTEFISFRLKDISEELINDQVRPALRKFGGILGVRSSEIPSCQMNVLVFNCCVCVFIDIKTIIISALSIWERSISPGRSVVGF